MAPSWPIKVAMNLFQAWSETALGAPDAPAIFWGEETLPHGILAHQAARLATHLVSHCGVQPGDRIGLWMPNRPEFVTALYGILGAGAVAVPINHFLKPSEVAYITRDADIRLMILDESRDAAYQDVLSDVPGLECLVIESLSLSSDSSAEPELPDPQEKDLAILIYTSGTTGRPKGAMLTHGNLLHNVQSCAEILETVPADRFAVFLPMFHSFMMTVGILLPTITGGSLVVVRTLSQPKMILKEILEGAATILPAIPPFFRALLAAQLPPNLPLRVCISGSAPLPVEVLNAFNQKFSAPLIEGYGLSEASPVVSLNPIHGVRKPGSIGLPIPRVEMSVRNDRNEALPPGEIGEICVRGGNVMQGYWNLEEATAEALQDGWLRTGDVGHYDEEGYFFITDRKKDMLLVNGINVYPREIEEVLHQFPGLKEVAVIGRPDPKRGEAPVAFVVPDEDIDPDLNAIRQHLRAKLADYKQPREIRLEPALPRNATGKILKTALRERL